MIKGLEQWNFGMDNERLIKLVLDGKKTATTSIYNGSIPKNGEEFIIINDIEKQVCVVKIVKTIITEFKNITEDLALLEGEGTFDEWKKVHIDFFKSIDPNFNEDTKVLFEIFETTRNLIQERLELANKIIETNKDIFGDVSSFYEIDAGFNNSIFNVDDKYVIKVCGNQDEENLFDVESNYYDSNTDSKCVPKLYKYDKTKKDVPVVYEIIEKISGKSVYYHWYKMTEEERKNFIAKLMPLIKEIHLKEYPSFDWASYIKNIVLDSFNKCRDMFSDEEQNIIDTSLNYYDEILSDNHFTLIHNDLHFDNILISDDNSIKLIDFNDSMVAPFDFDMRIFYMCQTRPWKWANIEMDPLQKPKDYNYIYDYVKQYYPELNNIKYIDERMQIYEIYNYIRHLPKYREEDSKNIVLNNSATILNTFQKVK